MGNRPAPAGHTSVTALRLRTGVLFHNGREVDAAAVQWNLTRMQDPHVGHPLTRSALANLRQTVVLDKYTVQCLDLYTMLESIVNEELPLFYLHHVTALQAGALHLKGYQPALSGLFSTRGGGIRTAWLA